MSKDITNTLKAKLVTANTKIAEVEHQLADTSARLDKAKGAISGLRAGGQELKDILDERNLEIHRLNSVLLTEQKELVSLRKKYHQEDLAATKHISSLRRALLDIQDTADIRRDALIRSNKRLGIATYVSITAVAFSALAFISIFLGA